MKDNLNIMGTDPLLGQKSESKSHVHSDKSPNGSNSGLIKEKQLEKVDSSNDNSSKSDSKVILIALAILIGSFALIFAGLNFYSNYVVTPEVIDIDDLHQENLAGELGNETAYTHNGFSFVKADGLWWTEVITIINDKRTLVKMPLHYGPRDFENVTLSGELTDEFNIGENVYVTIDPVANVSKYYTLGLAELSANLAKGIRRTPIGSCTINNSDCTGRDIISCDINPNNLPAIEFVESQEIESQIELLGNCIRITGKEEGIVKAVDYLILSWYGMN